MRSQESDSAKTGKGFDSAYGFSFAIAIGLVLFIAGLVVSLTLGQGTGLIFGIPLIIAGLGVPLLMMRGQFTQNEIAGACPYCGVGIKTSDSAIRLECPACNGLVAVRDLKLYPVES